MLRSCQPEGQSCNLKLVTMSPKTHYPCSPLVWFQKMKETPSFQVLFITHSCSASTAGAAAQLTSITDRWYVASCLIKTDRLHNIPMQWAKSWNAICQTQSKFHLFLHSIHATTRNCTLKVSNTLLCTPPPQTPIDYSMQGMRLCSFYEPSYLPIKENEFIFSFGSDK